MLDTGWPEEVPAMHSMGVQSLKPRDQPRAISHRNGHSGSISSSSCPKSTHLVIPHLSSPHAPHCVGSLDSTISLISKTSTVQQSVKFQDRIHHGTVAFQLCEFVYVTLASLPLHFCCRITYGTLWLDSPSTRTAVLVLH